MTQRQQSCVPSAKESENVIKSITKEYKNSKRTEEKLDRIKQKRQERQE